MSCLILASALHGRGTFASAAEAVSPNQPLATAEYSTLAHGTGSIRQSLAPWTHVKEYRLQLSQAGVLVDIYPNIVTAGIQVSKPNIGPAGISAKYLETGRSQWLQAHPFAKVNNHSDDLAATSLFNLKADTSYRVEVNVEGQIFNTEFRTQPDAFEFTPLRTLHVDQGASAGGDGTQARPFCSIQEAVDISQPGDRILVRPGTYHEHIRLKNSGTPGMWIQLKGDGSLGEVVIDGSDPAFHLESLTGWRPWTDWTSLGCSCPIDEELLWEIDLSGNPILGRTSLASVIRDSQAFFNYETHESGQAATDRLNSLRNVALGMRCRDTANECHPQAEGYYYDSQTHKLIVRSADHPTQHTYRVPVGPSAIMFDGHDWIWLEGFQFQYSKGQGRGAIDMNGGVDHSIIRSNRFVNTGNAIYLCTNDANGDRIINEGGSLNRIEFNTITDPHVGSLPYVTTKNNDMRGRPISIAAGYQNIVRGNTIDDSYLGIGNCWETELNDAGFVTYLNYETDIYQNTITNISSARLNIENQWVNTRVFENTMQNGHVGFAMLETHGGPIWYVRNVLHGFDGHPFKKYVPSSNGDPYTFFYHNNIIQTYLRKPYICSTTTLTACHNANLDWTPYWSDDKPDATCKYYNYLWGAAARFDHNPATYRFRNNIFYSTNYTTMTSPAPPLMDLDYDSFWRAGENTSFPGIAKISEDNTWYTEITELASRYGIEAHGLKADPGFADPGLSQYQLRPDSPLIDKGVWLPGINDAYAGSQPDMGAFEFIPAQTFADVSPSHPFFREIEALYRAGYTAGCNTDPLMYCPDNTMNRAESAVFVERGIHGTSGIPPQPGTQTFADLPLSSWAAKWAEALWQDHYTAGCGTDPLIYCPWQGHTRAEGCVFYLHMLNGPDFIPPQPSQQTFADVPLETWYAKWIQAAYDAALIPACQVEPDLRFCPNEPLSRGQAAYMMVRAKDLLPP